jgi:serine/threonine protein kinase
LPPPSSGKDRWGKPGGSLILWLAEKRNAMSGPEDLGQLHASEWAKFQELADQFQAAWQAGQTPDLEQFAPPAGSALRRLALRELVLIDLEMRWRQGQVVGLEQYLERFPEIGPTEATATKLIFEEYRIRHRHGDRPPLSSYEKRFPKQFEELRRLVEYQAVAVTPVATACPSQVTGPNSGGGAAAATGPLPEGVLPVGGGYKMIRRIGSGAFGEVWRAEAPGGFPAAVKVIFRPIDHEEAQRELQALEIIRGLNHRCLVQTHAYWSLQDRLFIVMELAEGSLRDCMKNARDKGQHGIPAKELMTYFRDAAEGLDYLHERHVLHRDIKPENILLIQGHAKVADFGLARLHGSQRMSTATGAGTPLYMAPEVFRGKISRHSDQYSLAMAYAELRLGRRLLTGDNLVDLMMQHLQELPNLDPLAAAEQTVLLKALAKDPEQRYATCSDWAADLEEALPEEDRPRSRSRLSGSRLPVGQESTEEIPSQQAPPRRRLGVPAMLLLMLLAASVPAGIFAYRRLATPPAGAGQPAAPVAGPASFTLGEVPPVVLPTGRTVECPLVLQHQDFPDPIELKFPSLPDGVTADPVTVAPGDGEKVVLRLHADKKVKPSRAQFTLQARGGNQRPELAVLSLTVVFLPDKAEPVGPEIVTDPQNGKPYYKRIRLLVEGMPFEFVVIPKARASDPETFYMMADKVSVAQFRKFVDWPEARVHSPWNSVGAGDDCPALGMDVEEAYHFAHDWLGGDLPSTEQWQKAAGVNEQDHKADQEGPYKGRWSGKGSLQIAVGGLNGPKPLGLMTDDVGPYGCRNTAGNGYEWTKTASRALKAVSVQELVKGDLVQLRGWSYKLPEPLSYEILAGNNKFKPNPAWEYGSRLKPDVSFRVVLQPE